MPSEPTDHSSSTEIVTPVVAPLAPLPPTKRSNAKLFAILGGVVLALLGAVFGGLAWWHSTPEYALTRVRDAVQNHDRELFYEFVDVDSVLNRAVDDVMTAMLAEKGGKDDGTNAIAAGFAQLMKPKLVEVAKSSIDRLLEGGEVKAAGKKQGPPVEDWFNNLRSPGAIAWKRTEGKLTVIGIDFTHEKYKLPVQLALKFRKVDGHLQLAELGLLKEMIARIEAAEQKWKTEQNDAVAARLQTAVKVTGVTVRKETDNWGINQQAVFNVTYENTSDVALKGFQVLVNLVDEDKNIVYSLPLQYMQPFPAHAQVTQAYSQDINQFKEADKRLWKTDIRQLTQEATVVAVQFDNGERMKLPYPEILAGVEE